MSEPIRSVAIIGAGHIGASIARACALHRPSINVRLYDADAGVRARAREIALGDIAESESGAVRDADLVILAVPVGRMGEAARACAPHMKDGAIISDVGSVKNAVVEAVLKETPDRLFFVAAHPLAGTEQSGPDAGLPHLFENRWLILTPQDDARPAYQQAITRLEEFWRGLGANVERMNAQRHDLVLAIVSHLPHLIAFNIVATAQDMESVSEGEVVKYSASGFRDFTRIAASDPTMWRDVFLNNREAVLEALGRFTEDLAALQRAVRWGDGETLFNTFARARRVRREVIDAGQDMAAPNFGRDQS